MFRFKRYDEGLLAESLARFGWRGLSVSPIGESDRAPMALLLVALTRGHPGATAEQVDTRPSIPCVALPVRSKADPGAHHG